MRKLVERVITDQDRMFIAGWVHSYLWGKSPHERSVGATEATAAYNHFAVDTGQVLPYLESVSGILAALVEIKLAELDPDSNFVLYRATRRPS